MSKHDKLLRWRASMFREQLTPDMLARSLTCESMPHEATPVPMRDAVTAFRHLRSDARVAVCRRFLESR